MQRYPATPRQPAPETVPSASRTVRVTSNFSEDEPRPATPSDGEPVTRRGPLRELRELS